MTTSPSSSGQQELAALGVRLRELRKDAGLTARALAVATDQHYTRVSKIEHGVQAPSDDDIRTWCRACGVDDQIHDLIATLRSVESAYLEFRRQSRAGLKRVLGAHTLKRYRQTTVFRIYEHNVIPGLLQTGDYSAAMLSFWIRFLEAPNDLREAVAARLERQEVLRRGGKKFVVILEEQALRTWFGSAETQAGQLHHLLATMALPNISVGVVPLMVERVAVASTGFWIFDDALVALETPTASIEVSRPDELALYVRMFEVLKASAIYGPAAKALIAEVIDDLT